jgi:hypothetical protein
MKYISILFLLFLSSCFLFRKSFRKSEFNYTSGGQSFSTPLRLPAGYSDVRTLTDDAGNQQKFYYYPGGAFFYIAKLNVDTIYKVEIDKDTYRYVDTTMNIPDLHPLGGLIYKGQDHRLQFWREIHIDKFRIGYHHANREMAIYLDSATNFASNNVRRGL